MSDKELVIKISEKVYNALTHTEFDASLVVDEMRKAIYNGTPLPEEHGDLIDRGKFKKWIETQDGDKLMTEYYLDALDMQETIVRGSCDGDID